MSAGTPVRGSPPLFHTLVPEQIRDALRRHLCNLWRCRVPVSASKSRGIFLTCNSPGTGGVHWRLLACPIAFRDDKAVRFRLFFHRFFTVSLRSLFCGLHRRLDRWKLFLLPFHDCRNLFPARFPFRLSTSLLPFLLHRIEPACRTPQGFRHAAACLPETYLAKLPPEQELVHEQIGEQQPEQNRSGFIT